ncbi:MAG: glycoside hydrolase family 3 N-terminal domain-containing protein [bacterium]
MALQIKATTTWNNSKLSFDERARRIVSKMTLAEKALQMVHNAPAVPRLGITAYNWWNEGLHGVARAGRATVFPQAIGMAAAFNPRLMQRVAEIISDEARAKYNAAIRINNRSQYFGLTYWSPNINIFRDPRWGRGQETYGEDPYLTAQLGKAFVHGLQGENPNFLKVAATAKHYAVHSGPESSRHSFNAVVSPRDLRETYLRAFRALVQEAGVESVMGAYNRTNGEPCNGSPALLQKILREEWGFKGYVVSDCLAIQDFHAGHKVTGGPLESVALAVKSGCDLNCGELFKELVKAVNEGALTEADLDQALVRLFTIRFKLGMFDPPAKGPWAHLKPAIVDCAAHRAIALRTAQESLVLLKNNGVLPLRKDLHGLFVTGPTAMNQMALLGNYNGLATQMTTILEGIVGHVSIGTQVNWSAGVDLTGERAPDAGLLQSQGGVPEVGAIIACVGYTADLEGEEGSGAGDGDRHHYGLPGQQLALLKELKKLGRPLIVVVTGGSPVDLSWAQEHADAILFAWYPGQEGGNAVADVLFGDYNPAGRLPVTFPKSYSQLPPFENYAMRGRTYRFMEAEPLYRFGYGLSYTSFRYRKIALGQTYITPETPVTVKVEVTNTGNCSGDEVAQLYIRDAQASVPVPRHHLEGMLRFNLKAGQTRLLSFPITPEALASYDDAGRPVVEPGDFVITIGGGQPDDPAAGAVATTLRVKASPVVPPAV